jgi:hypothetical protein
MLKTIKRSVPCHETWSRRDGDRSSINQASETLELGRETPTFASVLAKEVAVYWQHPALVLVDPSPTAGPMGT